MKNMAISKRTVNEMLESYLKEMGLSEDNVRTIKGNLHRGVKIRKELQTIESKENLKTQKAREKAEKKDSKSRVSHGTSCPRVMNEFGELVYEM